MAIVNMMPVSGGIVIPEYCAPFFLYKDTGSSNSTIAIAFSYSSADGFYFGPGPSNTYGTSSSNYMFFVPAVDFTADTLDESGNTQSFTFQRGKIYRIQYYKSSSTSKFIFKIHNITDDVQLCSYSQTTNRWSSFFLKNITIV